MMHGSHVPVPDIVGMNAIDAFDASGDCVERSGGSMAASPGW
jgi:hypothetical protein